MKHNQLRALAHNMADSLASGVCLMIGYHQVNVFEDARRSADRRICIDFLNGTISGARPSQQLLGAVAAFTAALPKICAQNRVPLAAIREFSAEYRSSGRHRLVTVIVADITGRRSQDDYAGRPLKRIRVLDQLGRVRRQKRRPGALLKA